MFGERLAEEVAMLGEPLAEGRWSTPVSAAFAELKWKYQAPEFEMFGKDCKIRIPEDSACEKLPK